MRQRKRAWNELSAEEQQHIHDLEQQLSRISDDNDPESIMDRRELEYEIGVTYLN